MSIPPGSSAVAHATLPVVETAPEAEAQEAEPERRPVLLDTNVLVYATNEDSPFFPRARELLDQALAGDLEAAITPQILAEYYAVITDPRRLDQPLTPQEARQQVEALLGAGTIRLLPLKESTSRQMVELAVRHEIRAQEIYDTQVVATMLDHEVPVILTANEPDFQRFDEIEVRNPFA